MPGALRRSQRIGHYLPSPHPNLGHRARRHVARGAIAWELFAITCGRFDPHQPLSFVTLLSSIRNRSLAPLDRAQHNPLNKDFLVKKLILAAGLLAAGLSTNAMASDLTGGFIRGDVGRTNVDVDGFDDNDTGLLFGGGYYFNENFAVEGFYTNLYDDSDVSLHGLGLGLVGKKSFGTDGEGFYIDGRAGIARMKGEAGSVDETSTDPYFGVGFGYDFNQNFGAGIKYTRFTGDFDGADVDANSLTASIEFRF
jgi:hypothetical protein